MSGKMVQLMHPVQSPKEKGGPGWMFQHIADGIMLAGSSKDVVLKRQAVGRCNRVLRPRSPGQHRIAAPPLLMHA